MTIELLCSQEAIAKLSSHIMLLKLNTFTHQKKNNF